MPNDMLPIMQTQDGEKVDDPSRAPVDPAAVPDGTSSRSRLLVPAGDPSVLERVPDTAPELAVPAIDPPAASADSVVRRLHKTATAAALDESRGSDGLDAQWSLRARLRAGQRVQREKLKLRR